MTAKEYLDQFPNCKPEKEVDWLGFANQFAAQESERAVNEERIRLMTIHNEADYVSNELINILKDKLSAAEQIEKDYTTLLDEWETERKRLEQALETEAILLTECLETITKLRPNNAGLGVLQHKLKVRLNKF